MYIRVYSESKIYVPNYIVKALIEVSMFSPVNHNFLLDRGPG